MLINSATKVMNLPRFFWFVSRIRLVGKLCKGIGLLGTTTTIENPYRLSSKNINNYNISQLIDTGINVFSGVIIIFFRKTGVTREKANINIRVE